MPRIELWCSIVEESHFDKNHKHLSPSSTFDAIRTHWTIDYRVEEIQIKYVESYHDFCSTCKKLKL